MSSRFIHIGSVGEHFVPSQQRRAEETDRQIDQLVYDLYGLSKEEIETVESNNAK